MPTLARSERTTMQFTVVPRDQSAPVEHTKRALENAIADFVPGMRLLKINPHTGTATVEIPADDVHRVRAVLGVEFMVDPNAPLKPLRQQ